MALKSSIAKLKLNLSDLDRNVYADFNLAVAQHPSETDARMMLRTAVFALHASDDLEFGRGISTDDEPDLWRKDLTGDIELWIDLGTPDPDRLRKACGRARQVVLYMYGERALKVWWEKNAEGLARFDNLQVYAITDTERDELGGLAAPNMNMQCTVSDGELWLTDGSQSIELKPRSMDIGSD